VILFILEKNPLQVVPHPKQATAYFFQPNTVWAHYFYFEQIFW